MGAGFIRSKPLQCYHNERDGVSNPRRLDVYSTVGSGADERKHQSSAFVAFKKTLIPLEYIDIKDGVPHGSV